MSLDPGEVKKKINISTVYSVFLPFEKQDAVLKLNRIMLKSWVLYMAKTTKSTPQKAYT